MSAQHVRHARKPLHGELVSESRLNDRLLALRNQCFGPAAFLRRAGILSFRQLVAILLVSLAAARADDSALRAALAKHILLFYSDNVRLPFSSQQDKDFRETLTRLFPSVYISARISAGTSFRKIRRPTWRLTSSARSTGRGHLGLVPALRGLAQEISRVHDLPVEFSSDDELEVISPDVKLCLFRIAQEALSNVVKPSGASHAEVRLVGANGTRSITLTVADDGKGFNPEIETDSLGIISMRERLTLVGGELRILSSRPAGTRVEISVPLGNGIPQQAASAV